MTEEEALARLLVIQEQDQEMAHMEADRLLCDIIKEQIGWTRVPDEFEKMAKWYA